MRFVTTARGFVTQRAADSDQPLAVGSRAAVARDGSILCSCMLTRGLGTNDFCPILLRSTDGGLTWTDLGPAFPQHRERWSFFASVSSAPDGRLFLFGSRTPIETPCETFWSDATQGLKPNELFWAVSQDDGRSWSEPNPIPLPVAGSAEAPGALCLTRGGRWIGPYSPYPTFDANLQVDRNQVVAVYSDDQGRTWQHTAMLRFPDARTGAAEAWVIELADGTLLATCWHLDHAENRELPNAFAVSRDHGTTWSPTGSTGILGQSTALSTLPDGHGLFVYNQRKHPPVGVRLATVAPSADGFGIKADQLIWEAETTTQSGSSGEHSEWEDFAFGEPSVTVLPDETLLVTLWCVQPAGRGIQFVKLRPAT